MTNAPNDPTASGAIADAAPTASTPPGDATTYDAIVVGAGFAGLTAARELGAAGKRVLVLEGRDRIAGRTWLDERMGLPLELGGTWVHWTQPYVWAELRRYGIGIAPSPEPQRAYWWDGTHTRTGDPDELLALIGVGKARLTERSREVFPQPFDVATAPGIDADALATLDRVTVLDAIAELELPDVERRLLTSFQALNFNGKLDDAAFTQLLRWVALTNGDWELCFEACASFKIDGGTRALSDAMHEAARAAGAENEFGADGCTSTT
ncbi:MAG: flavin monoamine oxidase family protein, partial [Pseudoclavibacter sp.]